MDKPKIPSTPELHRRLHNQGDLKAWAGPSAATNTTTARRREDREAVEKHVRDHLARGGKIDVIPAGVSGYEASPKSFVISTRRKASAR